MRVCVYVLEVVSSPLDEATVCTYIYFIIICCMLYGRAFKWDTWYTYTHIHWRGPYVFAVSVHVYALDCVFDFLFCTVFF